MVSTAPACDPTNLHRQHAAAHVDDGDHRSRLAAAAPRRPRIIRAARRVVGEPWTLWQLVNAQLRLRRRARVAPTVRLLGRASAPGEGTVVIGGRVRISGAVVPVEFHAGAGARIEIGAGTFVNYGVAISAAGSVSVGRECQIGQYSIIDDDNRDDVDSTGRSLPPRPVVLEDRVWLGARAIVHKGVRIGHDSVIGAGSVVTHDIPPRSIAVGSPAAVVRTF